MHHSTFLTTVLIVTANVARADWIDDKDVPSQCTDVCRPVVQASDHCEDQFKDDDDQRNCICTTANLNTIIPNCELCIRNSSDNDDKIRDLRQDCGFPSPTGTATGTSTGSARSTGSVTTSTSMATVTRGGSTTTSQSEATVTPTTGTEGAQSSSTSGSSNNDNNNDNQSGAGSNTASMAAAGAMAVGAVLMAMF